MDKNKSEMEQNPIRLLKAEEIECRVSVINERGLSLLLYKDARADQRILDETFGLFGWKRSHQYIGGNLYCTVEVLNKESGEWVAKQDVGKAGHTEKEKSQASDSFKRACFNWGIGRELYSAPFIWIPADKVKIQNKGDKFCCYENFTVVGIGYNEEREISEIKIAGGDGKVLFEMPARKEAMANEAAHGLTQIQMNALAAEMERTGVNVQDIRNRYKVRKLEEMTQELYDKAMRALGRMKSAQVA